MACCSQEDTFVSAPVKYLLFFFNFGCWLFGGVLIGIGVWAFIEKNRFYHKEVQTVYDIIFDLSVIFFVVGFIIFILGYAGCIGALRENICLLRFRSAYNATPPSTPTPTFINKNTNLYQYYITMVIIFLLLVVGAVLAFVFRDKVKQILVDVLQQNLITRYQDDPDGQSTIDWIQEKLFCCGVNGYKDWNNNQYFNCTDDNPSPLRCSVPYSCCRDPDVLTPGVPNILCGKDVLEELFSIDLADENYTVSKFVYYLLECGIMQSGDISIIYTIGCVDAGIRLAERELPVMGGIVIGLAVPQLFGICLSRLLEGQVMDQRARWGQN